MDEKEIIAFYEDACRQIITSVKKDAGAFNADILVEPLGLFRGYMSALAYMEDFKKLTQYNDQTTLQLFRLVSKSLAHKILLEGGDLPNEPSNEVYESLQHLLTWDAGIQEDKVSH